MRTTRVLLIVLIFSFPVDVGAHDVNPLFERAVTIYRANRQAISAIDCSYTENINGTSRLCEYSRDGEKLYHASVIELPEGGLSFPFVSAWNGQQSFVRPHLNYMVLSHDRSQAVPACTLPENAVNIYLADALEDGDRKGKPSYVLESAGESSIDDMPCVVLSFRCKDQPRKLTAYLGKKVGYWPIRIEYRDDDGKLLTEVKSVRYTSRTVQGNVLFYPVSVRTQSGSRTIMTWEVDETSLVLNGSISPARFNLEPWPSEDTWDRDRNKMTKAKDPTWSPAGKVGFPFDRFAALVQTGTPEPLTAQGADVKAVAAVEMKVAHASDSNLLWNTLLFTGTVVAMGGLCYIWMQKKHAAH